MKHVFPVYKKIDNFDGFIFIETLHLTLNTLQPVIIKTHVIKSDEAVKDCEVDGVKVKPLHKAICGATVTGEYKEKLYDFLELEEIIIKVDNGETEWYRSLCRNCLTQASFILGVLS